MFFSSIKEVNRLIHEGMSRIYYWKKLTISQLQFFSDRKFEEMKKSLKSKKVLGIFSEIFFSCLSSIKPCLRFHLICFPREIKLFYQSSLRNEFEFRDIMNNSPNILTKNLNFKKLRHDFADERAMIATTLIFSCHWKTLVTFWLQKKGPENASFTLTVNYRKIVQKNK